MELIQKNKIKIPNETICPSNKNQFNINTSQNIKSSTITLSDADNSSEENVTISPIKTIITSSSSKQPMIIEPICKLEKFLPPLNILNQNKKTLVLDLDETLIHSYFDHPPPRTPDISFDIFVENKKIHVSSILRPGVHEFLDNLESIFEIVIFTASLSQYANPVLDFIDKKNICKFRLFREHCCCFCNGFANSFIKDLKKLDRDMKSLIIIDNNPKSFMLNKENGIPIKTWVEDLNDRELFKLIPYMLFLGNEKIIDVRPFLKEINSGNSLNYEKFDKIILEFNNQREKNLQDIIEKNEYKEINQNIFDSIFEDSKNNNKESKKNIYKNIKENNIKNEEKKIINNNINNNENNNNNIKDKNSINKDEKIQKEKNTNKNNDIINNKTNNSNNNDNKKTKSEKMVTNRKKEEIKKNNKSITENDINKTKTTNFQNNLNNNIKENLKQNKNTIKKSITNKENLNNNNIKEEIKKDKKENRKKEINIIKRNDNLNKEIFNINLRNNSVNNKGNKQRQNKENYKTHNINNEIKKENKTKNEIKPKEDNLLIKELNTFDNNNVNNILLKNRKILKKSIDNTNNSSREMMIINLSKSNNDEKNNFFTKKSCNLASFKMSVKNNSDLKSFQDNNNYNQTNKLLNEFIKNLNNSNNLNSGSISKNNYFSEQDKTIINDDLEEEEKKEKIKENELSLFDDVDTEKDELNTDENDKKKNILKEIKENLSFQSNTKLKEVKEADDMILEHKKLNDDNIDNDIEYESNTINVKDDNKQKKKRKINKNLFNKTKKNQYKIITNKDKQDKLLINGIFSGSNPEQLDLKISSNFIYNNNNDSKNKFSKDILNYSTNKKRENIIKNISSSNYKIFKAKAKNNLFSKNKSNINNQAIDLFASKTKSISKQGSNIYNIQNKLTGTKSNINKDNLQTQLRFDKSKNINNNKYYILKNENKEKNIISLIDKDISNKIISADLSLKKRPTSCANKKYEGILYNNKIEKNKRIIRFTKQDKKIYLKTNDNKKKNINKKINLENINNIGIELNNDNINIGEEEKIDKILNKNSIINSVNNKSPKGNIITDIFFVKNLDLDKKMYNNYYEFKDNIDKNKIKIFNKNILL